MRRALAVAAAAAAAALGGCGGESGDLLAVEVSGGPPGTAHTLVVTNDGRGRCDGGPLRQIESDRLIDAREAERDLGDLAEEGARFGGTARGDRRAYVARIRAGTVRWTEGEARNPAVLARVELLALQLGRELCG